MMASADCADIVQLMLALAAKLGLRVTAVGVETREQAEFLHANGCDEIQAHGPVLLRAEVRAIWRSANRAAGARSLPPKGHAVT